MTLINLTPHPVAIYKNRSLEEGPEEVLPLSGTVARLATIDLGTHLSRHSGRSYELVEYGHVHDLPTPAAGTDYVVPLVVALAVRGRDDLLVPYVEVRNGDGTMVGCRFLQRIC